MSMFTLLISVHLVSVALTIGFLLPATGGATTTIR